MFFAPAINSASRVTNIQHSVLSETKIFHEILFASNSLQIRASVAVAFDDIPFPSTIPYKIRNLTKY